MFYFLHKYKKAVAYLRLPALSKCSASVGVKGTLIIVLLENYFTLYFFVCGFLRADLFSPSRHIQGLFELHQQGHVLLPELLLPLHSSACTPPLHMSIHRASRQIWISGLGTLVDQGRRAHKCRADPGKKSIAAANNSFLLSDLQACSSTVLLIYFTATE